MNCKTLLRITCYALALTASFCQSARGAQPVASIGSALPAGGGPAAASPYSAIASVGELGTVPQQAGAYTLNAGISARLGGAATVVPPVATNAPTLPFGVVQWQIRPSDTIPVGGTNTFTPNSPHVIMFSAGAPRRDQLVVFLPGTGGAPVRFQRFLGHAASLGFHSIGLAYPSDGSVAEACGPTTDGDCYQRIREDIIYRNPPQPEVNAFNSIVNRLELLLRHLYLTQPSNRWDNFYTPATGLIWENIIPAGHSQGAGHAGLIAKQNPCARVVMFAGGDFWSVYARPAPWNLLSSLTPRERWFSFTHYLDEGEFVPGANQIPTWQALGQTRFGDIVDVDVEIPPYRDSHTVTTKVVPPIGVDPHGFTVNDSATPLDSANQPIYAPVWSHLLTGSEVSPTPPSLVADSIINFSGIQNSNNWSYGYWDRTASPASFVMTLLPMFGATRSSVSAWIEDIATPVAVTNVPVNLAIADANRTNHIVTAIWDTGCELNMRNPATGAPQEHWPVRRWTSTVNGPIRIEGNLAMFDTGGGLGAGDGVEARIRINGLEIWTGTVNADDAVGILYSVSGNVQTGQFVEFILAPRGSNGEHDAARFTAKIYDDCGASLAESESGDFRIGLERNIDGEPRMSFETRRGRSYQIRGLRAFGTYDPVEHDLQFSRSRRNQSVPLNQFILPEVNDEVLFAENNPQNAFFTIQSELPNSDIPPSAPGHYKLSMVQDCQQRRYLLFIPSNYDPTNATPLLFVFHGGGQTAVSFATRHPDLIAEADAAGMILVLPQATVLTHPAPGGGMISETHWFADDPEPGQTDYVDDVDFVLALIEHLDTSLNLDSNRIYAAGFSNGAKFCHYLGGRTFGVFAALAPVAGYIGNGLPPGPLGYVPPPTEALPIMMVNGGQDTSVPYNGGLSAGGPLRSSVAEAVHHWAAAGQCAATATTTTNGVAPSMVLTTRYATCAPGMEVILHSVQNMPHEWPDAGDTYNAAPISFDANKEVVAFFKTQSR